MVISYARMSKKLSASMLVIVLNPHKPPRLIRDDGLDEAGPMLPHSTSGRTRYSNQKMPIHHTYLFGLTPKNDRYDLNSG